jgi:hypothetical protein
MKQLIIRSLLVFVVLLIPRTVIEFAFRENPVQPGERTTV